MEEELKRIKNAALPLILDAKSLEELDELKLHFLGRSGELTVTMKGMKKVPKEEKPRMGQLVNEVKAIIEQAIASTKNSLSSKKQKHIQQSLDVTDPGIKPPLGHLHLVTQAINDITAIFERIGFTRVRYPEVEFDWYAFEALNFPENHPARDDWETFFIDQKPDPKKGSVILTPHTSSGQIREMEEHKPPIRIINIAKTYRRQSDTTHTPMFHQFEGLCVDKGISIVHLKGVLDFFAKSYFGTNRKTRIRPYHFQFTEPSFEVDITCGVCEGSGEVNGEKCKLCKAGWLELGGAGMVHPNVLRAVGINPDEYSGFAFGFGPERCLMMKEGLEIDDLRLLYSNKLEFLEQF